MKIPFLSAIVFGIFATLLYLASGFMAGDGRLGVWHLIYMIGRPISWAITQITARLEGHVSNSLFGFSYVAGVIVAGTIWVFVVVLTLQYLTTRRRGRN